MVGDRAEALVEVIEGGGRHERLGQGGDAPHEMRTALRVQLREHVVEQEQRRAPVEGRQEVQLGELEREDRGALLAARRECRQVAAGELERDVVTVRPDERGAVPDLLLVRLDEPSLERVTWRLPGEWRSVA